MSVELLEIAERVAEAFRHLERTRDRLQAARLAQAELSRIAPPPYLAEGIMRLRSVIDDLHEGSQPLGTARAVCLNVEGGILGHVVRNGTLPDDLRARYGSLVAGEGPVTVEGIERANRWIRGPFIDGFQAITGDRPIGIVGHLRRPDLISAPFLQKALGRGGPVFFKPESRQTVRSFKGRGARNTLIHDRITGRIRQPGINSHGNAAQGVAESGLLLGLGRAALFLPENASQMKIDQCRAMVGSENVHLVGTTFEQAEQAAIAWQLENPDGRVFVHAYDNPLVVEGQGTIGIEIGLQMAALGYSEYAVLVPAGGGGLIGGIATYLAPLGIPVFGAESMAHPYVSLSLRAGKIVEPAEQEHVETIADGIALFRVGKAAFPNILQHVRDVVAVPEREIEAALAFLHDHGTNAEGAAATPVAALMGGALDLDRHNIPADLPIVTVLSGDYIDRSLLDRVVTAYGGGRSVWLGETVKPLRRRLQDRLETTGFLEDGRIKTFKTADEGIRFVSAVGEEIGTDCDLLEGLEMAFNLFPPWEDGDHTMVKSLRSFAMYQGRWDGDKKQALLHPAGNRMGSFLSHVTLLSERSASISEFADQFHLLTRIRVEMAVLSRTLDRGGVAEAVERAAQHALGNMKQAFGIFTRHLGITLDDFDRMDEAQFRAAIARIASTPTA